MNKLSLIAVALLAACASPSAVTPYGDGYMVSMSDWSGLSSPDGLQVEAAKQANDYCAKQGKRALPRTRDDHGVTVWTSTSSSLVFTCE